MTVTLAKLILVLALIQTTALGQGGISLAGSDYSSPSPLLVAPGQIITLRVIGLKTILPTNAPVRAASVPLPKSLAGISVVLTQTGPALTEQLPFFAVQQFNQCGGADSNTMSPDCIITALTVQVPFDIAVPVLDVGRIVPSPGQSTAISILEAGGSSKSFAVQPIPFNSHILNSCDLVLGVPPPIFPASCEPIVTHADGSAINNLNPAKVNEILVMYAVGLGVTVPPAVAGEMSPSRPPYAHPNAGVRYLYNHSRPPGAGDYFGTFSGLAPGLVGVYQLNFPVIPPSLDQSFDCSVFGPALRFGIDSSFETFAQSQSYLERDTAALCVDTKAADALPFPSVAPMAIKIPKVLRNAFGPEPSRNPR